ncbi:MAG: glycerol-3-phosphate 1-O-acyltransferase PlsY [Bryobacteraceae bacterium]
MPVLALALAYLLGGIPFGFLLVKWTSGKDVREAGSGNIGAANVYRTAGPWIGLATLVLDAAKGLLAVWLADRLTGGDLLWMSAAALAAIAGHAFPPFLRFRGGKAVATFFGAYFYLAPQALLAVIVVFLVMTAWTRHVSLGSITAAGTLPFAVWLILHPPLPLVLAAVAGGAFVVYRHSANIQRLREGTESRI